MHIEPSTITIEELIKIYSEDHEFDLNHEVKAPKNILQKTFIMGGMILSLSTNPLPRTITIHNASMDIKIIKEVDDDYDRICEFNDEIMRIKDSLYFIDIIEDEDSIIENELIVEYMESMKKIYSDKKRPYVL